jgi:predicted protein tyrosine phosphatase
MMIASLQEAVSLCPAKLAGWNILSIRGRTNELPLRFPGARRVKTLRFDDVETDCPEERLFAPRLEDIHEALKFSREVEGEPILIHCFAGISRSTAIAWIIIYDELRSEPDAVRQSFEMVRRLRPILIPNRHVLRLGVEELAPKQSQKRILRQFQDCLLELNYPYAQEF